MLRRFAPLGLILTLLISAGVSAPVSARPDDKSLNAEQVAELTIYAYGSRAGLLQIRRNGIENGRMTRVGSDGRAEEATYVRRFIRGESADKDRVRLDQKLPTMEFSLIYGGGRTFGIINGSAFTPRQDATVGFNADLWHGLDALLRYKENGSTINLVGKDKDGIIELYVLDVVDKEKRKTRYYISAKTFRVLKLEFEESLDGGAPVKYARKFYDYRAAQGTLVPFRTVLYEDGKQTQETRIMTITYGIRLEESLFQNPDAQASTTQP